MAHPLFSFLQSFFHRISRMNRRHSCLSDYSRIFAELWPLANGWRPKYSPYCYCHADFADDADFSSWKLFFLSHRFHRLHRFFMESLANRFVQSQGYLYRPNRSPLRQSVSNRRSKNPPNKFRLIR